MNAPRGRFRRLLLVATVLAGTAGCSGTQDEAVASVADGLLSAVGSGDGARACRLLAPATRTELEDSSGTPCARAVLQEGIDAASGAAGVEVFDTTAQAVVGSQTLFLSRYDGRWLVIAAACTAVPRRPYDCSIGLP